MHDAEKAFAALAVGLIVVASCALPSAAAEESRFIGRVVVELLDSVEFDHKLRLAEDFGFQDPDGKLWLARKDGILEGCSLPPEVRALLAPEAGLRKAIVVHDYFCREKSEPWRQTHRMLYHANLAEQMTRPEAKVLHMAMHAGGWRWETKQSSCFRTCHQGARVLAWKPVSEPGDMRPLIDWIWQQDPSLEEIEARVDSLIRKPGPHLFGQVR
jgi:hypothetical protein